MGRGLWACLQVRGYLLGALCTPGWKNCSSGVRLILTVLAWPCPLLWVPSECCCRVIEALGASLGPSRGF